MHVSCHYEHFIWEIRVRNHSDKVAPYQDLIVLSRVVDDDQPEVIKELTTGKAETLAEAIRNVKAAKIVEGESLVPEGEFRTVIVDPPWPMKKIDRETERPNQGADIGSDGQQYSTMTLEEIAAFPVPAHKESHCYLWTWTHSQCRRTRTFACPQLRNTPR